MLKTYLIQGKEFQTIKIPKGTILFRGIVFENKNNFHSLFKDLIGVKDETRYKISPTTNVFFYPVPYVSDIVDMFNVHIMYVTQYDLELIMLVSPSTLQRGNKNILDPKLSPIATCSHISEYDKCGYTMSKDDPCLTDIIINRFPQIDGFIGLTAQDIALINKKYKDLININKSHQLVKHIIPSIITNARGLSGIPEIVLHPLRFRYNECHYILRQFRNPDNIIKYCMAHRPQYNYFPILYFTNNGVFTFNDLKEDNTIKKIEESIRIIDPPTIPKVYEYINEIFNKFLTTGYKVDNILYKILIDRRTGFYKILQDTYSKRRITHKKEKRQGDSGLESYLDSYIIKPTNNSEINTILSTHKEYIDDYLLRNLYANGYSLKKKLVFNRKNKNKFIYNYYINKMIDRPDIDKYTSKRERNKNITRKNINSKFSNMLAYDALNLNELNNISSVDTI
jgi:hypothetical protein